MANSETLRAINVRSGKRLELLTIGWNSLEALIAITAGVIAGSIALVGFGFDSVIEVSSGVALLWRLSLDADVHRRERIEAVTLKIVGVTFVAHAGQRRQRHGGERVVGSRSHLGSQYPRCRL
jgi:divalent metal cation (Fe/Co/Zn/Cd) transporter